MAKTILLIDNDAPLAAALATALSARGLELLTTADGNEGLDLARERSPALIILCVELPHGSGYSVCSKLKKDKDLHSLPVLLTSASAKQKTFDEHGRLKIGRADGYLLKPFSSDALLAKISTLIEVPSALPAAPHPTPPPTPEDALAREEPLDVSGLAEEIAGEEPEPGQTIGELSLDAEEAAQATEPPPGEPDFELVDAVFENLEDEEVPAATAIASPPPPPAPAVVEPSRSTGSTRDKDYFALKERLAQRERELLRVRDELNAKDRELVEQRDRELTLEQELSSKDEVAGERAAEIETSKRKIDALLADQQRAEEALATAQERAAEAASQLQALEQELVSAAAAAQERAAAAASQLQALEQELVSAKAAAEERAEDQRAAAERQEVELQALRAQLAEANSTIEGLRHRAWDLEDAQAKSEDRVTQAYQKVKHDEAVKERVRKAVAIALELLGDAEPEGSPEAAESAQRS